MVTHPGYRRPSGRLYMNIDFGRDVYLGHLFRMLIPQMDVHISEMRLWTSIMNRPSATLRSSDGYDCREGEVDF